MRGYSLVNPKELPINTSLALYDNAGYLWLFSPSAIRKVYIEEILDVPQLKINANISDYAEVVNNRTGSYKTGVLAGRYFYVAPSLVFSYFLKIDSLTGEVETINTPISRCENIEMNSNIHFEGSKLWMVTNKSLDQGNDKHKVYFYDIHTKEWGYSAINCKRQTKDFKVWSFAGDYVYVSSTGGFTVSHLDKLTGIYLGEIPVNGETTIAANRFNTTAFVASHNGMVSELTNANIISHTLSSVASLTTGSCSILYVQPNFIWFQWVDGFGRIKISDKSVLLSKLPDGVDIELGDSKLLSAVSTQCLDLFGIKQEMYELNNSSFTQLVSIPEYSYIDKNGNAKTAKEKLALIGSVVTIFDPDMVKFVYEGSIQKSGVYCTGKGMISSGETDYIGDYSVRA